MLIVGSTVYMGGGFTQLGGIERNFAGAVNVNGIIAETWKPLANGKVLALAVEGSTIYLGGAFTEIDGIPRNHLAAVALSGELNTTWAPNVNDDVLTITSGTVSSNAPGPSPMLLYFGGNFTQVDGTVRNHAAAVGLDGAVSEWNPNVNGPVNALVCKTYDDVCDGVFIGGSFTEVGGIACNNLASWYYFYDVLQSRSSQGLSEFKPNPNGPISSLAYNSRDGGIYVGGDFTEVAGSSRRYAAAFEGEFNFLSDWRPEPDGPALSLSIETKDKNTLYLGGSFSSVRAELRTFAAAVNSDGALNSNWRPRLRGLGGVDAITLSEGTVFLGGRLTEVDANERGIVAFDTSGVLQETFNPRITGGTVQAIAAIGDRVYLGGTFTQVDDIRRNLLVSLYRVNGGVVPDWDAQIDAAEGNEVSALATAGDTLFVGGKFNSVRGASRYSAAALTTAGELSQWSPAFSGNVNTLAVEDGTIYAGGNFREVGGLQRQNAAAVDLEGNINRTWQPMCDREVLAIDVSSSDVYLGGNFTRVDGETRHRFVAAVGKDGTLRTAWSPGLNNEVSSLSVSDSAIFVGGKFTKSDDVQSDYLALIDPVTGAPIPIPTATPTPTPTATPTMTVPPVPTVEPQPSMAKPVVKWSIRYTTSVVRGFVTRMKGVAYSISATSRGATKTGRCSIDRRTRKVLCTIDLSKGTWLVSVYPHKQGATGRPARIRATFRR
jgi:hypothetical protein